MPLASSAQPLPELYHAARSIDPAVLGAQAEVRAAEERLFQARAGFGPTAVATGSKSTTDYSEAPSYDKRSFDSKQASVQVTQPLFRGTLFASLDSAKALLEQAQAKLDQANAEAIQRLVEACFDVLKARDALIFAEAQQAATVEQLVAAQRSFKIGTAPIIDVREAEAKADTVAAQVDAARYDLDLRKQILAEIVGHDVPDLTDRGLDGRRLPSIDSAALIDWLTDALVQSPQLRQARQAMSAADAEVLRARLGHAPTADLTYTYTRSNETGSLTSTFPRRGDSSAVGVVINMPLFASGATQAKVRETIALQDKAQNDIDAARRGVTLGVRQGFSTTLSSISQARGLETAAHSAEVAVRANRRGYDVGMKVNTDVLDSLSRLFEVRLNLSRARYDAWLSYVKLKGLSGQLEEADVADIDSLLRAVEPQPDDLTFGHKPNRKREGGQ